MTALRNTLAAILLALAGWLAVSPSRPLPRRSTPSRRMVLVDADEYARLKAAVGETVEATA